MPNVVLADRVLVQFTTTGTGTYSLGAALAGFMDFAQAAVASGSRVSYVAVDSLTAPTQFEIGEGVYTSGAPSTLTRAAIGRSTGGATSAVNWAAGTKYIFLSPRTVRMVVKDTDGNLPVGGKLITLSPATAETDAARFDQVGWRFISESIVAAPSSGVIFTLSGYNRYRVEFSDVVPASAAALFARFSTDAGVSYHQGATDYQASQHYHGGTSGTQHVVAGAAGSTIPLTQNAATTAAMFGALEFHAGTNKMALGDAAYYTGAGLFWRHHTAAHLTVGGATVTHVLLGIVSANISSGRFRLLGGV